MAIAAFELAAVLWPCGPLLDYSDVLCCQPAFLVGLCSPALCLRRNGHLHSSNHQISGPARMLYMYVLYCYTSLRRLNTVGMLQLGD